MAGSYRQHASGGELRAECLEIRRAGAGQRLLVSRAGRCSQAKFLEYQIDRLLRQTSKSCQLSTDKRKKVIQPRRVIPDEMSPRNALLKMTKAVLAEGERSHAGISEKNRHTRKICFRNNPVRFAKQIFDFRVDDLNGVKGPFVA